MRIKGIHRCSVFGTGVLLLAALVTPAQQITETRDPNQTQDEEFARLYREWTGDPKYGSPLVDHLPLAEGIPTPKDVLGHYIGAPETLTYYGDMLKFYRALAAATPRVRVEPIGRSNEGRELVVVWVSSEENMRSLAANRSRLAMIADPRGLTEEEIRRLIATTKPHYHLIGGLHNGEVGAPEMLMELVYRIATETSPFITQIRNNVYVSVTPAAEADGRDRNVDWFYHGLEVAKAEPSHPTSSGQEGAPSGGEEDRGVRRERNPAGSLPYLGKYVNHDDNRDINIALAESRAFTDWYFTSHPPIVHDLHESLALMYTYSGGPPQNPNLDPLLFAELRWFSNWELAQMTKWGMPGVYTHAFMDGWSPGYFASVAYNHNGLMKMYETQSGRDPEPRVTEDSGDRPAAKAGERPAAKTAGSPAAKAGARPVAKTAERPAAKAGERPAITAGGAPPSQPAGERRGAPAAGRRESAVPTGRGGAQDREWYRGIPVPPNAAATFSRRNNINYMQTGVLSSLQLTSMFPSIVVENFYIKTRNSIEEGKSTAPHGFVIPVQRDMTRAAALIRILRIQGIEVGQATNDFEVGDSKFPAGSYVVKRDQPYGRLAKNLLEKQVYPDARLRTYDDSGWTMGLAMAVDVKEIADPAILEVKTTPVERVVLRGKLSGAGTRGLAVAHYGSNNMIAFRYRLRSVPMKITEKSFTAEGVEFPPGSLIIDGPINADVRSAVEELGLTGATLGSLPTVPMHDTVAPRIAIYSEWSRTQDLGWYRLTFDNFSIPYDLIYKEQVKRGNLRGKYDVILMAAQNINREAVFQPPADRPQPYVKSDKYQFLGMYGETPDMSGGFGHEGLDAFAKFLESGGTLIAASSAIRLPIEFGWARTVDAEQVSDVTAQRPIVQAEISQPDHPVFYGYAEKTIPIKYLSGTVLRAGAADQGNILARYVGGDESVLSGLMTGADQLNQRPLAVDVPNAYNGKGRVILFANNPIYRWQNHGEFNMIFNALLNWNYVPPPAPKTPSSDEERGGGERRP